MKNIITLLFSIVSISAVAQNLAWTVTLVPVSFQLETSNGLPCRLEVNTEVPLRLKLETVNMIRYGYGWYMNEITPNEPTFTVNGIANGNSSVGQIVVEADRQVIFKAPLQKPGKNPVEVMASYNGLSVNGRIFDTSIICRIEMFGENSLRLAPDTAKLLVWSQLPLQIFRDSSGRSYEVGQLLGRDGSPKQPEWTVNGIPNGNYSVGMLSMDPLHTASFLSPSVLPDKNPVEIIANFREVYLNGQYADRKLVAHVEIIEGEWTINMDPEYELLAVNSKLPYQAFVQYKSLNPEVHGAQQPVYGWGWNFGSFTPNPPEWTVNGIPDGNKLTGQIIMNVNAPYDVTFKAPAHRPTKNPVEIRATYKDVKISERVFDTTFTSFIEIIEGNVTDSKNNEGKNNDSEAGNGGNEKVKDRKEKDPKFRDPQTIDSTLTEARLFEVNMISQMDGSAGSVLGKVTYRDAGSFVVSVWGKQAKLIQKVNKNLPDKLDYKGKCTVTQLKPGSGLIDIGAVQSIRVIPSFSKGTPATIEVIFIRSPLVLPLLQFVCPNPGRGKFTSTSAQANAMAAAMIPAFPQQIRFEAKEGQQTILQLGKEGDVMFVKFTVRQLTSETVNRMTR